MLDAVVVGAGQAGLAASWHLRRLGVDHVVLEQAAAGDSWRTTRWDSFRLNTPAWANLLPGETNPMAPRDAFHTRDDWADHLGAYAMGCSLPVEEGSPATRVEPDGHDDAFVVRVGGADPRVMRARSVIVASGMQRVPRVPAVAATLPPGVRSLHTAEYRAAGALPPGGVLVVGGGQSGCQIAEDLLGAGRSVWLAASPAPRMRRRYRGRDIFEWLAEVGFFDERLTDLPDPAMRWWPQPQISGIGPGGHTLSLQSAAAHGATLTGRVSAVEGPLVRFAPDLGASIRMADIASARMLERIDAFILEHGLSEPAAEDDVADRPVEDPDAWPSPDRLDLAEAGVTSVIWATGFGADLSWLRLPMRLQRGLPMHPDGEIVPGLWFLGIPWMRRRKSGIILGADEDGALVAERAATRAR
jgi:putative flavoprotein involved in K+ transport